ncbi:hypothetical protein [Nocardia callitridis]|uniref:Uncharacterized protein n=1 Tax=Nocardia callitridis TaxID=648753 RepID=A0ABP9JY15_9NOCA
MRVGVGADYSARFETRPRQHPSRAVLEALSSAPLLNLGVDVPGPLLSDGRREVVDGAPGNAEKPAGRLPIRGFAQ